MGAHEKSDTLPRTRVGLRVANTHCVAGGANIGCRSSAALAARLPALGSGGTWSPPALWFRQERFYAAVMHISDESLGLVAYGEHGTRGLADYGFCSTSEHELSEPAAT